MNLHKIIMIYAWKGKTFNEPQHSMQKSLSYNLAANMQIRNMQMRWFA